MNSTLKIFIAQDCPGCAEAQRIATHIEQNYPDFMVEVIDIADSADEVPDTVFATPTFMLENRVVSLGNPKLEEVDRWVKDKYNS